MDTYWSVSFLLVCCIGLQSTSAKPLFDIFQTKLNGQQNLSYGFTEKRGLKPDEKQAILDMTNALRRMIGTGGERNTPVGLAPNGTNIMVMEWDDALAEFAQRWADTCPTGHSDLNVTQSNYSAAVISENLSGGTVLIQIDMYGEVHGWTYVTQSCLPNHQCGHYNTLVSWSNFRLGCGYSVCTQGITSTVTLVCEFAPFRSAGIDIEKGKPRYKFQYEYWTNLNPNTKKVPDAYAPSPPCSDCLQGWDYCMDGGLCATKEQCDSDPTNKCVCMNDKAKCEGNGGTFDAANCRCKCPEDKYGLNCANKCQNMPHEIACGMTCGNSMVELFHCYKSCGSCGKAVSRAYTYWQVERKTRNKHGLKVRARSPHPVPAIPKDVVTKRLPKRGKCPNKNADYFCENVRRRNYCQDAVNGAMWRYYCAGSCNSCNNKDWQNFIKARMAANPTPKANNTWQPIPPGSGSGAGGAYQDSSGSGSGAGGAYQDYPESGSGSGSGAYQDYPESGSGSTSDGAW